MPMAPMPHTAPSGGEPFDLMVERMQATGGGNAGPVWPA